MGFRVEWIFVGASFRESRLWISGLFGAQRLRQRLRDMWPPCHQDKERDTQKHEAWGRGRAWLFCVYGLGFGV